MFKTMKPGVQSTHPANSGNRRPSAIPLPHGSKPHDNYQWIQDFIKKLENIYDDNNKFVRPVTMRYGVLRAI